MAGQRETNTAPVKHNVPAGYEERGGDVAGFWDPEYNALHFIPRTVKLMDSSIDSEKVSALVTGELVEDAELRKSGDDGEIITAKKGALVGVWYKPGMRAIRTLGGVPVYIYADGAKDVGKGNPMRTFKVLSKAKTGARILIESDSRKDSAGLNTDFDPPKTGEVPFDHSANGQ